MWLNASFHRVDGLSGAVKNCALLASVASLLVAAGWNSMSTPMTEAQPQSKLYVGVPSPGNGAILRFDDPATLTGRVTATAMIAGDLTRLDRNLVSMALDPTADRL